MKLAFGLGRSTVNYVAHPPKLHTDSGHTELQPEDHVEFFPFEPTDSVGILSNLQVFATHPEYEPTGFHEPEEIHVSAGGEHQLNKNCKI